MRQIWYRSLTLWSSAALIAACVNQSAPPAPTAAGTAPPPASPSPTPAALRYETVVQPQSTVHLLTVPAGWVVQPAVAPDVASLDEFAAQFNAVAVLNGGFFDPVNGLTTSYVTIDRRLAADPQTNDRLINNPDLTNYLPQILDRSEFRRYQCEAETRYAITRHSAPSPADCQLIDAIGAGPQLLPHSTAPEEAFVEVVNGQTVRDALGSSQPNARSAVGIKPSGEIVLVMVAQRSDRPTASGMTFAELADFLRSIGVQQALNLDGGSSAAFFYQGETSYGRVDAEGNLIQRPVKSVLIVRPQ